MMLTSRLFISESATIPASSEISSRMHWWASIGGILLIFVILMDAFETVVLPRRIKRHFFRISLRFYKRSWGLWTRLAQHIKSPNRRETFLAYYGPLSLFPLLGRTPPPWRWPPDVMVTAVGTHVAYVTALAAVDDTLGRVGT